MFKHFFQVAWRQLLKRKFYTFINITGLATGMTCCIIIAMYVRHETSYDHYNVKKDRIFRVLQTFRAVQPGETLAAPSPADYQVWGCAPVGPALQADYPQIEKIVQFMSPLSLLLQKGDTRIQQDKILAIDSTAFDVFSWKMLQGNPHTALIAPNSIVLTETVAKKFFKDGNAIGQTLRVDNQVNFQVTGVMEDVPSNSHFNFNGLISMSTARNQRSEIFNAWGYVDFYTYVLLKENADIKPLQTQATAFVTKHNSEDKGYSIKFEKLGDAYLNSLASRQPGTTGSKTNIYLFSCIAIFILLIACVNFMNLSTARSLERAKEVGVRKVLGVRPSRLMWQFLMESVMLSIAAMTIAVLLARTCSPLIEKIAGKEFADHSFFTPLPLLGILAFSIIIGLLAGIYPAWFLSGFKPISVLKGKFNPSGKGIVLRKALVVFQFTLSIALIAATAVVYNQLRYIDNHELGFRKDQMLIVNFEGDEQVEKQIEPIKNAIAAIPGVNAVAASRAVPGEFLPNAGTDIQSPDGQMLFKGPLIYEVDFDFISTYNIPLIAGRGYSRAFTTDSAGSMVINEAAARLYGYKNPADAVGRNFNQWGRKGTIIGVVKDFHFRSLHQTVEPLTLRYGYPWSLNRISVSVKGDIPATIAGIKQVWDKMAPQRPFLYHFLDQSFGAQYESDRHFGQLFTLFSILAIGIACLGLIGLSTFMAQQRVKEIGIRKVLGSSLTGIVVLLSKDFIKLVAFAIAIAVPICWWAMHDWLQGFAYRITIGPLIFIEAGAIALIIAIATIGWQSIRAALANPIDSLRNE